MLLTEPVGRARGCGVHRVIVVAQPASLRRARVFREKGSMTLRIKIARTFAIIEALNGLTRRCASIALVAALLVNVTVPTVAQTIPSSQDSNVPSGSPLTSQLQLPGATIQPDNINGNGSQKGATSQPQTLIIASPGQNAGTQSLSASPAKPGEFEKFVELRVGHKLPRFGASLIIPSARDFALPATATIPPDYLLGVGDQIAISLTGSIEGSAEVTINTEGKVFLPHIGSVTLAGVRYADVKSRIAGLIGQQYHGYTVTVEVKKLRGIRVYVTGFATSPGGYAVNSLSTLVNAVLAAGGPSAGGSFRGIKLYRNQHLVTDFDLYDLIRRGNRGHDAVLQNEDVIFIPPVGDQIAVTGSVHEEAIYETKPGESLAAVLALAGGTNALADGSRVELYRLSNLNTFGGLEVPQGALASTLANNGDIVQVLSNGTLQQPVERQAILVRVEGEVNAPGSYYLAPGSRMDDVIRLAGGLSPRAFLYGSRVERFSVKEQQRVSFDEAIQQLELSLASAPLKNNGLTDQGTLATQLAGARAVVERLKKVEPDGRIIFDIAPDANRFPADFLLENNDHIVIPARPIIVGVFGSVYHPASFLFDADRPQQIRTYVERAGGPLKLADKHEIFVVRANGAVLSYRRGAMSAVALPGDVIFVPVKTSSSSVLAKLLQFSSLLFQVGLTTAALISVTK